MIPSIKNSYKAKKSSEKAFVLSTDDPQGLNRVQVYIPSVQNSNNLESIYTTWCSCGIPVKPNEQDVVMVSYENNDLRAPSIISNITQAMTLDANGTSVDASTLISLIQEVLKENEGTYDSVVANDHGSKTDYGGVSVGLLGWHENNARDDVFKVIKETNLSDWGNGDNLRSLDQTWVHYIPDDTDVSLMKTILATETSHTVQDNVIINYINGYLEDADSLGITDAKCKIYYCDIANQNSGDAIAVAEWVGSSNLNDLDKFHNKILSGTGYPAENESNRNRRIRTYNKILEFESSGRLSAALASGSATGSLLWPIPGYPKISFPFGYSSGYDGWHGGVDINNDGNTVGTETCDGAKLVACCDGTAIFTSSSEWGNSIRIQKTGTTFYCYYFHLSKFASGFSAGTEGYNVTTGQLIGYVGKTGHANGTHLHFEIRSGGTDDGNRSESNHGNLVDPEPYMLPDGVSVSSGGSSSSNDDEENAINYDTIIRNENCPPLAKTDYSKIGLTQLVPFLNCKWYDNGRNNYGVGSKYNPGSLFPEVQNAFDEMKAAFDEFCPWKTEHPEWPDYFVIKTGFRSYQDQMKLRAQRESEEPDEKHTRTSPAGFSEHQLGLAIDICTDILEYWDATDPEHPEHPLYIIKNWLKDNAYKYGFIVRYISEGNAGYKPRPYHLRYVGKELAEKIYNYKEDHTAMLEDILATTT